MIKWQHNEEVASDVPPRFLFVYCLLSVWKTLCVCVSAREGRLSYWSPCMKCVWAYVYVYSLLATTIIFICRVFELLYETLPLNFTMRLFLVPSKKNYAPCNFAKKIALTCVAGMTNQRRYLRGIFALTLCLASLTVMGSVFVDVLFPINCNLLMIATD